MTEPWEHDAYSYWAGETYPELREDPPPVVERPVRDEDRRKVVLRAVRRYARRRTARWSR